MGNYRRGDKSRQRLKRLIEETLATGEHVDVLFIQPEAEKWKGLPIEPAWGLEIGLIKTLRPAWNGQGKG